MEEILGYLIGAALLTAWAVGGVKKVVRTFWPDYMLDAWEVLTVTTLANFGVAWLQFGARYPWWTLLVASLAVATGAKIGYDGSKALQEAHTPKGNGGSGDGAGK